MSRSSPSLTNPAKYFMSWSGSRGQLEHYDKERKVNVPVKMPFEFLVIDHLFTITGYSKQAESGFWSNEARSTVNDHLTVRTKSGIEAQGTYNDIKDTIKAKGAKYAQSVYIVHKVADEFVLSNLQISGAALSPWIDLSKAHKVEDGGKVVLNGKTEEKTGTNTFFAPTFEYVSASKEEDSAAFAADRELQVYLSQYFAAHKAVELVPDDVDQSVGLATPEQQASYVKPSRKDMTSDPVTTYQEIAGNEDISAGLSPEELDQIPF